jgi:hypothetical protein
MVGRQLLENHRVATGETQTAFPVHEPFGNVLSIHVKQAWTNILARVWLST